MALAARLAETRPNRSGARCSVCRLLAELPKAEAETLKKALDGDVYQSRQIAEALQAEGYPVSKNTLARHRRGDCLGSV